MNSIEVRHTEIYIASLYMLRTSIKQSIDQLRKDAPTKVDWSFQDRTLKVLDANIREEEDILLGYKLS